MSELDGVWEVRRLSGALPPMTGVRKRIHGARGETVIVGGPGVPFDVRGYELRYRAPFAFRVSLEYLDTGATTTILFLLQPEDVDSTRIYTRLLLSSGPGRPLPAPGTVAAEVAFEHRVLQEDRELQGIMATTGLPLDMRDELHVRSDRLGIALRRVLCEFAMAGRGRGAA